MVKKEMEQEPTEEVPVKNEWDELGIQETNDFTTRGRGAWQMDDVQEGTDPETNEPIIRKGIKSLVREMSEKHEFWAVRIDGFVKRFHPSGDVKYRGYYVKKHILEAGQDLKLKLGATQKENLVKVKQL